MSAADIRFSRQPTPALPDFTSKFAQIGLLTLLLLVMTFFYLLALNNSPLLGGQWGLFTTEFEFYIIFVFTAMAIAGTWATPVELPGATSKFLFWAAIWLMITWGALSAFVFYAAFPTGPQLSGGLRIAQFVAVVAFVAPVEEYLFRVVLPPKFGWILGSIVFFAAFHLGAYSIQNGLSADLGTLFRNLISAGVLGGILFALYDFRLPVKNPVTGAKPKGDRLFGFGAVYGFHAAYDLVVLGAIGPFGLTLAHLGLVPV